MVFCRKPNAANAVLLAAGLMQWQWPRDWRILISALQVEREEFESWLDCWG
jgi:hypothetical protein